MADLRISSNLPAVAAPAAPRTSEAVRAAQRAFFDTALSNAAAPAAARTAAASRLEATPIERPAPAAIQPALTASTEGQEPPTRPMRPGSLLDIRV